MASRKLIIEVVGDASKLDKSFKQAQQSTNKFGKSLDGLNRGGLAGLASFTRGGAIAAGLGVVAVGFKKISDAARDSEVVLGQTRVAVENAGRSWGQFGKLIEDAAQQISRASSFDDEEVLKSFSVFVRGNQDVAKSLDLAQLAADVARGRYTDLNTATQLVNKAALGQVGALRRAGIQIDNTATSTEALAELQKRFAGSAEKFSKSAAGQADRLKVSWENLLEDLGQNTNNQVGQTQSALASLVDALDGVVRKNSEVQESWQRMVSGISESVPDFTRGAQAINDAFGLGRLTKRPAAPVAFGQPGFKPGGSPPVPLGPSVEQRNRWFDDMIGRKIDRVQDIGTLKGQVAAFREIEGLIQKRIDITKDITRRLNLEDQLVGVRRQRKSVLEEIADNEAEAAQKIRDKANKQRQAMIDAAKAVRDGMKRISDALKDRDTKAANLTKTTALSTERILAGLGLSPADERVLRARLSHFNSAGRGLVGAGSGSGGVAVNVPVTVNVDGKVVAKTSAKYNRRSRSLNPSQRNGPNAGLIIT